MTISHLMNGSHLNISAPTDNPKIRESKQKFCRKSFKKEKKEKIS
jgi:hypothetical protein